MFDLEAIEKQAFALMIAARETPRYDLYAKVWMNADRDLRKAKAAAKKEAKKATHDEPVFPTIEGGPPVTTVTADTGPAPQPVTRGRGPRPVA